MFSIFLSWLHVPEAAVLLQLLVYGPKNLRFPLCGGMYDLLCATRVPNFDPLPVITLMMVAPPQQLPNTQNVH